jgi:hypothetical protein
LAAANTRAFVAGATLAPAVKVRLTADWETFANFATCIEVTGFFFFFSMNIKYHRFNESLLLNTSKK